MFQIGIHRCTGNKTETIDVSACMARSAARKRTTESGTFGKKVDWIRGSG